MSMELTADRPVHFIYLTFCAELLAAAEVVPAGSPNLMLVIDQILPQEAGFQGP